MIFTNAAGGHIRLLLATLLLWVVSLSSYATHNRAGEITYRNIGGLTFEVSVLTYTYTPSLADRPDLIVKWGDGTESTIYRTSKVNLPNDVSRNVYIGTHTYSGPGIFVVSVEDPNRNAGIINMLQSVNLPFYIESVIRVSQFLGVNSSPVLLNPPLDLGCVSKPYIHNPGAYDPDGDSLAYSLIPCKMGANQTAPGYTLPQASQSFTINPFTGTVSWLNPVMRGEYNIAILIEEFRNGILIGSVTRDMQIMIESCNNDPPVISALNDTCVEAGTFLSFNVIATDAVNQLITLSASGGPLVVQPNPAFFPTVSGNGFVSGLFQWQTECEHVRNQPWNVLFKAIDNGSPISLASFKTVQVKVICPSPKNVTALPAGNSIQVKWDEVVCKNAIGYKLYRRNGSNPFTPGLCETGMPAWAGYQLIARKNSVSDTVFLDDNQGAGLTHGLDYCYRVVAFFADSADSYVSDEACTSLIKNVAVITNVSVRNTSSANGSMDLIWSKPNQIDTLQHPGPYAYHIYRGSNPNALVLIDSLNSLNDTVYVDTLLNTLSSSYFYRVDLVSIDPANRYLIGKSSRASSVFLRSSPTDQKLVLNWDHQVPWSNYRYIIYRKNPLALQFDSIGGTTLTTFTDSGLTNGETYCYRVESVGTYFSQGYVDPLLNFSQEICDSPIDNVSPCAPALIVEYDCDNFLNRLFWTNPSNFCEDKDVQEYEIYYSPSAQSDFSLIATIFNANDTFYIHQGMPSIAGCYLVVAIDSTGNRSKYSNQECVDIDNCDLYRLPNVFTPNGDGVNDRFQPFMPYSFVDKIEISIYNRWGQVVYTTTDPDINWDGTYKDTGQQCAEGVYFFVCYVYELRLSGVTRRTINGSVTLFR